MLVPIFQPTQDHTPSQSLPREPPLSYYKLILDKYYHGDQINKYEIGVACSKHWRDEGAHSFSPEV
jgi:hypothetical protein